MGNHLTNLVRQFVVYFEGRPFFFGAFFGGTLEDSGLALETFFAIYILGLQNVTAKNPLYTHIILENINIVKIILKGVDISTHLCYTKDS